MGPTTTSNSDGRMVDNNGTQEMEKYKQWHIAHELISNGINTICCTPVAYNEFSKKRLLDYVLGHTK
jgi:hypothetical protein